MKGKKQHIDFMRTDFQVLEQSPIVIKLLKANYKALGYPFGLNKIVYNEPIKTETGYYISASIYLSYFDYMRKCANSYSNALQKVCHEWVKANYPEQENYYLDLVEKIKMQRALQLAKKNIGE